ncbi:MAG: carboxyl transferase domain-containing protein [Nakamurella sp.]
MTTIRVGAREIIDHFLDEGTFVSWDVAPIQLPMSAAYAAALGEARQKSGLDEAIITGEGLLRGRRVAVVAGEFAFLGGSIGVAATERLVRAVELATLERIPLLASPVSGGTRMQEGTVAFLQMVKISGAVAAHKAAGLPYLVYLRSPTTGGVLASWGSLGHLTVAEPGALVGFLGPRVYQALYGEPFPEGVQTAENLYAHGLLDAVLPASELPKIVHRVLNVLLAPRFRRETPEPADPIEAVRPHDPDDAWASIKRSRRPDRPGVRKLLRIAATDVTPLNGTGTGEVDPGILLALARFDGAPCVLLGQDRIGQTSDQPLGPAALREARRGMRLAAELHLPLVTVIDTPGAALSKEAEEGGLAGEIARCLADLVTIDAPTVSVLLGQGTGGGALALVPADRVMAARHGWLSPLPPEGASAIIHRDTTHAAEMAAEQGVRAADLLAAGIIDRIVDERDDAADEPTAFCLRLGAALADELYQLMPVPAAERAHRRHQRYRRLGLPGVG